MKLDRSWTHKREHQLLSRQLVAASGSAFRAAVLPLLRAAFHESALSWRPDSLPELGEEHIVWWSGEEAPLVTACLAFAGPELGEEEIRKVQEVIRRFAGSAVRTGRYLLVHNGESRSRESREAITAELQALTAAARVDRAESWDRQRLLSSAFNGMLRHARESLQRTNLSTAPLEALKRQTGFVPLEEVPCDLSLLRFNQHQLCEVIPQTQELLDPATAMLDPRGGLLTLVTGEFGLGKTTAVARAVARETRPILYVAGARISKETSGKKDFLQQCIDQEQLFAGFPSEDHPTLEKLSRAVIEYLLQDAESKALVIIDGLDESAFLGRRGGGFQQLFNILQDVQSPIVLTLRTEFWDRGVDSFAVAFGTPAGHGERRNRKIRRIDLLAWGDDRIRMLIRRSLEGASDPVARARLEELAELLDRGELSRLYGDIPRRPLFLRLLLDTVIEEGLPAIGTGRARLLHDWALRKLYRDIQSPIAAGGEGRLPIVSENESDTRAVEIAWEAMLQAAVAMIEVEDGNLELAADCTLDEVRHASPELGRIEEPLGIFLNSLLLSAGPVPRGLPIRLRFAHRAFQEFFLAWFALIRPALLPAGSLPDPVRDWMAQIQAEGLLPAPSTPVKNKVAILHPMQSKTTSPPDLEMRVRTFPENGRTRLSYTLQSSTGAAQFFHREIAGPTIQGSPEDYQAHLLQKLGNLADRRDVDRTELLQTEIERKLASLGRQLWRELFPPELQQAYRDFRGSVRTWLLVSDEPWIPWELIKPFDNSRTGDVIDDDFLALRFELTRWLAGDKVPAPEIGIHRLAAIRTAEDLPQSGEELSFLSDLAAQMGIELIPQAPDSAEDLLGFLETGGVEALHFLGHGRFIAESPDDSPIPLPDGSLIRPGDLEGPLLTQIGQARPLVILNACWGAQQGWSLTRIGGWAARWVGVAGCGAFVAPLWPVRDQAALAFTRTFYGALARGATLGQAGLEARQHLRETRPGDPSALAYVVYGHPNARVVFGSEEPATLPEISVPLQQPRVPPIAPPKPVPATSTNLRIKKKFSDQEKDLFIEETFESIASFFERSLGQIEQQNPGVGTRFRRIDSDHFSARIYVQDQKPSTCRIWLSRGHMGDIAYHWDDSAGDNTYSAVLWVENDGYSMWFKPGLQVFSSGKERLNAQEAAEYFWSMLMKGLQ
jgi:hypothetical protein